MFWRKGFLILIIFLTLGLVLVGCGQKDKVDQSNILGQEEIQENVEHEPPEPISISPKWHTKKWYSNNFAVSEDGKEIYTGWPAILNSKDGEKIWAGDNFENRDFFVCPACIFADIGATDLIIKKRGKTILSKRVKDFGVDIGIVGLSRNGEKIFVADLPALYKTDCRIIGIEKSGKVVLDVKETFLQERHFSFFFSDNGEYLLRLTSSSVLFGTPGILSLFGDEGKIWEKDLKDFPGVSSHTWIGIENPTAIGISPDSKYIAVGLTTKFYEGGVEEVTNSIVVFDINGKKALEFKIDGAPQKIEVAKGGKYFVVEVLKEDSGNSTNEIALFDQNGQEKWSQGEFKSPCFVRDDEYIVALGEDSEIFCFDLAGHQRWFTSSGQDFTKTGVGAGFSSNSDGTAIIGSDGLELYFFEIPESAYK